MYMLLLYMLTYHLIYVELTETYLGYITFYWYVHGIAIYFYLAFDWHGFKRNYLLKQQNAIREQYYKTFFVQSFWFQ